MSAVEKLKNTVSIMSGCKATATVAQPEKTAAGHCHARAMRDDRPCDYKIPVVPHKAVAEVSKLGHYRRGELLRSMDGRANPLMDRQVVGVVFFGMVTMVAVVTWSVTSRATAGCSVV